MCVKYPASVLYKIDICLIVCYYNIVMKPSDVINHSLEKPDTFVRGTKYSACVLYKIDVYLIVCYYKEVQNIHWLKLFQRIITILSKSRILICIKYPICVLYRITSLSEPDTYIIIISDLFVRETCFSKQSYVMITIS